MAESLLRQVYGEKYDVYSAGTNPTSVNPLAIKVLAELGIDASKQYSKGLEEFSEKDIDLAVAVCKSSEKTLHSLLITHNDESPTNHQCKTAQNQKLSCTWLRGSIRS
jgi:protein-tyrosine-phosphatase